MWDKFRELFGEQADGPKWPAVGRIRGTSSKAESRELFLGTVLPILGKAAACDGKLPRDHHYVIEQYFRANFGMTKEQLLQAMHIFYKAGRTDTPTEILLATYLDMFGHKPQMLYVFVDTMLHLAHIDGSLGPEAKVFISDVARVLGVDPGQYQVLQDVHEKKVEAQKASEESVTSSVAAPLSEEFKNIVKEATGKVQEDPYSVLGLNKQDSDENIKRKFRDWIFHNHPDRLAAQGVKKKELELARAIFQKKLKAYDSIKRERHLR